MRDRMEGNGSAGGQVAHPGRSVMSRRKQRLCRSCKKSPVWRGGDVKDPGPYCKRCYHQHVWAGRSSQGNKDPGGTDQNHFLVASACPVRDRRVEPSPSPIFLISE